MTRLDRIILSVLLGSVFCAPAIADEPVVLEWGDLYYEEQFELRQLIRFENAEFDEGERFRYESHYAIPGVNVMLVTARPLKCRAHDAEHDIILVRPEGGAPDERDRSVGVALLRGCELEFYVEHADFFSPSLFRSLPGSPR